MILCVDAKALETSVEVQKAVDLEKIMNDHTKYYNSVEEALKDNFVPLDFCVSIRSIYSNLVVQTTKEDGSRLYYTNITNVQPLPHKGYDLIMYLASICVLSNIKYADGFDDLMFRHSQFMPMGIFNPNPIILNPIIYIHIIVSDEGMEELTKYLKDDREIVNISDIKKDGNLPTFLDTLIVVKKKEEEENAEHNDN